MTASPASALVVGGGPAGLAAANHLLDAGFAVTLLEARAGLGGRAASDVVDGFTLNQGPHAFYLGGAARTELAALGIDPPGRVPMPADPASCAPTAPRAPCWPRPPLRVMARALRARPEALTWHVGGRLGSATTRSARALPHIATYTGPLERLSADAPVLQLRAVLRGVRYLHGGWQSLVDALTTRAGPRRGLRTRRRRPLADARRRRLGRRHRRRRARGRRRDRRRRRPGASRAAARRRARAARPAGRRLRARPRPAPACRGRAAVRRRASTRRATRPCTRRRRDRRPAACCSASPATAARRASALEAFADALQPGWRDEVLDDPPPAADDDDHRASRRRRAAAWPGAPAPRCRARRARSWPATGSARAACCSTRRCRARPPRARRRGRRHRRAPAARP